MESMSVLAAAMNESLLQSHDGTVRVAPACRGGQAARFTLHAAGGFVVSAEVRDGAALWVHVESLRGGELRIARPWERFHVFRDGAGRPSPEGEVLSLATRPGERLLLAPGADAAATWKLAAASPEANAAHKVDSTGRAMLGLPRLF